MILYEFEGKELLSKAGSTVPQSQLLTYALVHDGASIIPMNVISWFGTL